jgi:hypothetical protein
MGWGGVGWRRDLRAFLSFFLYLRACVSKGYAKVLKYTGALESVADAHLRLSILVAHTWRLNDSRKGTSSYWGLLLLLLFLLLLFLGLLLLCHFFVVGLAYYYQGKGYCVWIHGRLWYLKGFFGPFGNKAIFIWGFWKLEILVIESYNILKDFGLNILDLRKKNK